MFGAQFEKALAEVASASGELDERALARLVAARVAELLQAATAMVARFDRGRSTVLGTAGPLPTPRHGSLSAALAAELLRAGAPMRVANDGHLDGALARQGLSCVIVVPVRIAGRLWGGLFAGAVDPGQYPLGTERLLARFGVLISSALANAETQRRLREQIEFERVLREIASASASGELDQRALASRAAEQLSRLLNSTITVITRPDGDHLTTLGYHAPAPPPERFSLDEVSLAATAVNSARPVRVDDRRTLTGASAAMAIAHGLQCAISVPIRLHGRPWGAITAGTRRPRGFTATSERHLERFGALVAVSFAHTEAAAALRESEARHRMVVEATSDGIADLDMRTGALWWSPRLMRTLGYTARTFGASQQWVNEHVVHPDDRRQLTKSLIGALDESTTVLRLRAAAGEFRTMLARSALERDQNGNVVRRITAYSDVTELDRAEARRVALARELHDSLTAQLGSIRSQVAKAGRLAQHHLGPLAAALEALEAPLACAEETMGLVVRALRPDTTLLDAREGIAALTDTLA